MPMFDLPRRRLGPFAVSAIGLGCMNVSHAYGEPPPAAQGEALVRAAFDAGVDWFDTAALYGFGANESLGGRALQGVRQRITLCSKGGMTGQPGPDGKKVRVIDGRPASIRRDCEDSLRRLGTDVIDLWTLHRLDPKVPVEDSVGAMSRLVEQGKVRALGLSEVSAATLERAHAVHPIATLQTEYSLWTRNPEIAVLDACRRLGVAFVAFSPLGRGFLADGVGDVAALHATDIRRTMPRFAPEPHAHNRTLLAQFKALAAEAGVTPAQLALAWVLSRGDDVLPIPGTTRIDHLHEDLGAAAVRLAPEVAARAEALFTRQRVRGARYHPATQPEVGTEEFDA